MLHVALWLLSWKDSVESVAFLKLVTICVDSTTAVKSQRTDSKRTWVIDLFAGYGSLRAVAKAQGLNYLAVDMRDLMSAAKKADKQPAKSSNRV